MNETTRETSWDAPTLAPEMAMELAETAETAAGEDEQGETGTALASWPGDDGGIEHHGAAGNNSQEHSLAVPPAAESQFAFYVNERGNRVFMVPRKAQS